ncbi:MAG: hypothetical protein LBH65_06485 [Desulfovibrio sp.]|nr:hypothetical protein [Desulfovibrio sp.]
MPTIMPQSELLKKAVVFVNASQSDQPGKPLAEILDEAAMRFNLSPLDAEALQRLFDKDPGNG